MGRQVCNGNTEAGDPELRVAITGAAGFVGRYLVAEFLRRGIAPIIILRPSSRTPPDFESLTIVRLDFLAPPQDVFNLIGRPDALIHLAWEGLPHYQELYHFERELPLQYRLLKCLVESGLQSLLVSGTCFEYGMRDGCLSEKMEAAPANPYAFAKDTLRRQLAFLKQTQPFALTWARLFYLYGDGQPSTSIFGQLQEAVGRGDHTFKMSAGEQLRDYLHIAKAADYLASLGLEKRDMGIVNVCSGQPISMRKLVETWIAERGWPISPALGHYPYTRHEPLAFWGDNAKLQECVGKQ
jgi:nucleoside-diphosphate-sugar epimerase